VITNSPGGSGTYLSSSITPAGNGWYRCYVSGNTNNAVNYQFRINLMDNTNSSTYNGDGGSAVYIWGAQAETSPAYPSGIDIPSSYIKTTSSQVSRSTDNISITGNAFNSFYNYLQGTIAICADINYLSVVANPVYFMFTGGTSTPYIWRNSGFKTNYVSGVTTSVTTGPASNNAYSYNMVYAYKANSYVISCQNSSTLYLSSTPNLYPNCTSLLFGSYAGFNAVLGGHLKTFAYYSFAASNTQLLSLSQNPLGL
jgi:hypothetical protein